MFTFQENSSQYIYHYTGSQTAIEFILPNGNLRLSSYAKTNDPKEFKEWFFIPGTNEGENLNKYTSAYLSNVMNPILKHSTNLLCFSKDKKLSGDHLEDTSKRGFCKPRMWAQYGGNHTGVCLIFDYKKFTQIFHEKFKDKTYTFDHVEYRDRVIADIQMEPAFIVNVDYLKKLGEDNYAYSHGQKFSKRLFFEKATDWANEDEFRFIVFDCKEQLYIEYQRSLAGILFGQNCSDGDISKMVNLTKGKGLEYQKLNWRNCTPWFDFGRTKWL